MCSKRLVLVPLPGNSTSTVPPRAGEGTSVYNHSGKIQYDSQSSDLEEAEDDSDEYYMTDDSDSEDSDKGHETQKKAKRFHGFFEDLDCLTDEQLEEHDRQWHCPACRGGVGSIDWFRGLGPLASHARTMRSRYCLAQLARLNFVVMKFLIIYLKNNAQTPSQDVLLSEVDIVIGYLHQLVYYINWLF